MRTETQEAFWVVWNPASRSPLFRHSSLENAEREATRLATNNPGQQFIVLQTITSHQSRGVTKTLHVMPKADTPF